MLSPSRYLSRTPTKISLLYNRRCNEATKETHGFRGLGKGKAVKEGAVLGLEDQGLLIDPDRSGRVHSSNAASQLSLSQRLRLHSFSYLLFQSICFHLSLFSGAHGLTAEAI